MYHCVTSCVVYIKIHVVAVKTWLYHCLYLGRVNKVIKCQIIKLKKKPLNNSVIFALAVYCWCVSYNHFSFNADNENTKHFCGMLVIVVMFKYVF